MLERLNQAMERIELRLGAGVEVEELAQIAGTSVYHLRRMFSALAGMPLSEYVRRRRLTLAAAEVVAGRETLLDIAVRHGYGSGEAFARAFRAMHGVGPSQARRAGVTLSSQPRMSFRLVVEGNSDMRHRIERKQAFGVVGYKTRVPLVHAGPNQAIIDFVRGIGREDLERLAKLSDQQPEGVVAVCDDLDPSRAEGTELDYYQGAVTSSPAPEGLAELAVPAGTWAVFTVSGPMPLAVQTLWRDVFMQWFPSNPYVSRPGPEILRVRPTGAGSEAFAELWLPVEGAVGG
ncbi:AraC family transcriptional regulator [Streptomyces seoulensis]|uniref:AraC family transcriptional regulator n=1 Tax=Streptomyces seoulensis TaxID=73044 RepID=A0A4V0ZZ34_STRSO|nr:AraC family transcriptional regulator [Streptomyces seoulensis]QBJ89696.1 AraC family transcriptional regulator [Streptomyces seoulensis]